VTVLPGSPGRKAPEEARDVTVLPGPPGRKAPEEARDVTVLPGPPRSRTCLWGLLRKPPCIMSDV